MKPKIGILTGRTITNINRPFKDSFNFVNNFPKRIEKAGGIPIGILFPDSKFKEEYLQIYDGFLLTSGSVCQPYHLATIHYAIKNNKPLLGICLGHQTLGIYSYIIDKLEKMNITPTYNKIINFYTTLKEDETLFLKEIKGHNNHPTFYYSNIPNSKHKIKIKENTHLFEIYKKQQIEQPSLHNFVIKNPGKKFKIAATSEEGYIESIEYNNQDNFIIGTQFHAELEKQNDILFQKLIEKAKTRI